MPSDKDLSYIDSTDYQTLSKRIKDVTDSMDDLIIQQRARRKLRYAEVDIEAEREAGHFQPDEVVIPQHIIDTNIRREQAPYVKYITQSPRAVICEDVIDKTLDMSNLESDLTKKLRYDGWQMAMFSNIDCFQANGYGVIKIIQDPTTPGELSFEAVEFADFGFCADSRDLQQLEMTVQAHYFTATRLKGLQGGLEDVAGDETSVWNVEQVQKVLDAPANDNVSIEDYDLRDKSLHQIFEVMLRVKGTVMVGWACPMLCNNWLRNPRPLFIGRRKLTEPQMPKGAPSPQAIQGQQSQQLQVDPQEVQQFQSWQQFQMQCKAAKKPCRLQDWAITVIQSGGTPPSEKTNETEYPYILFPYLISENNTISNLKGRVYLDQDVQEAVFSLLSSACTQARRASGLYGSKDSTDPNDDVLMQKNITLKSGCIVNSKINFTQLQAPDPGIFSAIQMIIAGNQNETSNVNFAVQNRQDSRKTAKEMSLAEEQAQELSTVQVVLFSLALKKLYSSMVAVIQSRVMSGLITIDPPVLPLYARRLIIKPSGDTDVIERDAMIQKMQQSWPVVKDTPAAMPFLFIMLEKMFPENAAKFIAAIQQGMQQQQQQQNSAQATMMKQGLLLVKSLAEGVKKLASHPEMFSDMGRLHAFPIVEHWNDTIEQVEEQIKEGTKQNGQTARK
jgi:hypothetical protein